MDKERLVIDVPVEEYEALAELAGALKVKQGTGRPGKLPWTALVRAMASISRVVLVGYPAIVEQALNGDKDD